MNVIISIVVIGIFLYFFAGLICVMIMGSSKNIQQADKFQFIIELEPSKKDLKNHPSTRRISSDASQSKNQIFFFSHPCSPEEKPSFSCPTGWEVTSARLSSSTDAAGLTEWPQSAPAPMLPDAHLPEV